MIYDLLEHSGLYEGLGRHFAEAFAYLKGFDPSTPNGKIPLKGDDLFAVVQSYEPTPAAQRPFEAHRKYLDIQFVCRGEEIIQYAPLTGLTETQAYADASDCALFSGPDGFPLYMPAGSFAVFFPNDGHKPGCLWTSGGNVKKVVMKLKL